MDKFEFLRKAKEVIQKSRLDRLAEIDKEILELANDIKVMEEGLGQTVDDPEIKEIEKNLSDQAKNESWHIKLSRAVIGRKIRGAVEDKQLDVPEQAKVKLAVLDAAAKIKYLNGQREEILKDAEGAEKSEAELKLKIAEVNRQVDGVMDKYSQTIDEKQFEGSLSDEKIRKKIDKVSYFLDTHSADAEIQREIADLTEAETVRIVKELVEKNFGDYLNSKIPLFSITDENVRTALAVRAIEKGASEYLDNFDIKEPANLMRIAVALNNKQGQEAIAKYAEMFSGLDDEIKLGLLDMCRRRSKELEGEFIQGIGFKSREARKEAIDWFLKLDTADLRRLGSRFVNPVLLAVTDNDEKQLIEILSERNLDHVGQLIDLRDDLKMVLLKKYVDNNESGWIPFFNVLHIQDIEQRKNLFEYAYAKFPDECMFHFSKFGIRGQRNSDFSIPILRDFIEKAEESKRIDLEVIPIASINDHNERLALVRDLARVSPVSLAKELGEYDLPKDEIQEIAFTAIENGPTSLEKLVEIPELQDTETQNALVNRWLEYCSDDDMGWINLDKIELNLNTDTKLSLARKYAGLKVHPSSIKKHLRPVYFHVKWTNEDKEAIEMMIDAYIKGLPDLMQLFDEGYFEDRLYRGEVLTTAYSAAIPTEYKELLIKRMLEFFEKRKNGYSGIGIQYKMSWEEQLRNLEHLEQEQERDDSDEPEDDSPRSPAYH